MPRLGQTIAALKSSKRADGNARANGRLRAVRGFGSNPGQLTMKVHAPAHIPAGAALVVVLHGCTQTAEDYAAPAGWLDLADRFGFVVLAPEQVRANNPNLCFNWYQTHDIQRGGGEAESIAQMVSHAIRTHGLDERRVFITGLSAGGAMTSVLLATHPAMFAAGAVVAGLPYGVAHSLPEAFEAMAIAAPPSDHELASLVRQATAHSGPWPTVSVWHGQADHVVRPAAGEAVAAQWRDVHGAMAEARAARTPDGREFVVWLSPDGDPVVELHRIPGLGHGAPVKAAGPNGCGHPSRYTPETGLSSSFEIALGWGLVQRDDTASLRDHGAAGQSSRLNPPAPSPGGSDAVTRVINDALRAAGLLR